MLNGLRFYTPDRVNGKVFTAYEYVESLMTAMDLADVERVEAGVFAITPSGEQVLADLDVSGLQSCEADTKRANGRS